MRIFFNNPTVKKLIVSRLILGLLCSNISLAEPPINTPHPPLSPKLFIPESYGKIDQPSISIHEQTEQKVILIKDAHCNYEAQTNISHILDILIKDYKIDLVCVEGASGLVNPSLIASHCDNPAVRKKVTDKYVKTGLLTASEALSINKGPEPGFTIWGVENLRLYLKDYQAFKNTIETNGETTRFVKLLSKVISQLKKKLYPEKLQKFDDEINRYEINEIPLTNFIKFLTLITPFSTSEYPTLDLVLQSIRLEEKIYFGKVETERGTLIKYMENHLPKEDLRKLIKQSLLFKLGKIPQVDYYTYLEEYFTAYRSSITAPMENLEKYFKLVKMQVQIDETKLFKELEEFQESIYTDLIPNEKARQLHELDKDIKVLTKVLNLESTKQDFTYYKDNRHKFKPEKLIQFIKIQAPANNINLPPELNDPVFLEKVKTALVPSEEFYDLALGRDHALVENLLKTMEKNKKNIAVLIVGGFHTEGIKDLLIEKDISPIIITPSITKPQEDSHELYLARIMDERIKPEMILAKLGLENLQFILLLSKLGLEHYETEVEELIRELEREGLAGEVEKLAEISTKEEFLGKLKARIEQTGKSRSVLGVIQKLLPEQKTSPEPEAGQEESPPKTGIWEFDINKHDPNNLREIDDIISDLEKYNVFWQSADAETKKLVTARIENLRRLPKFIQGKLGSKVKIKSINVKGSFLWGPGIIEGIEHYYPKDIDILVIVDGYEESSPIIHLTPDERSTLFPDQNWISNKLEIKLIGTRNFTSSDSLDPQLNRAISARFTGVTISGSVFFTEHPPLSMMLEKIADLIRAARHEDIRATGEYNHFIHRINILRSYYTLLEDPHISKDNTDAALRVIEEELEKIRPYLLSKIRVIKRLAEVNLWFLYITNMSPEFMDILEEQESILSIANIELLYNELLTNGVTARRLTTEEGIFQIEYAILEAEENLNAAIQHIHKQQEPPSAHMEAIVIPEKYQSTMLERDTSIGVEEIAQTTPTEDLALTETVTAKMDEELLNRLDKNGEEFLAILSRALARAKEYPDTNIDNLSSGLLVALLTSSPGIAENHTADGFIGLNAYSIELYNTIKNKFNIETADKFIQWLLEHELAHELTGKGKEIEPQLMQRDAQRFVELFGKDAGAILNLLTVQNRFAESVVENLFEGIRSKPKTANAYVDALCDIASNGQGNTASPALSSIEFLIGQPYIPLQIKRKFAAALIQATEHEQRRICDFAEGIITRIQANGFISKNIKNLFAQKLKTAKKDKKEETYEEYELNATKSFGIYNRKKYEEDLVKLLKEGNKTVQTVCLKIQRFKEEFNTRGERLASGHTLGDLALTEVGPQLQKYLDTALEGTGATATVYNEGPVFYIIFQNTEGNTAERVINTLIEEGSEFKKSIMGLLKPQHTAIVEKLTQKLDPSTLERDIHFYREIIGRLIVENEEFRRRVIENANLKGLNAEDFDIKDLSTYESTTEELIRGNEVFRAWAIETIRQALIQEKEEFTAGILNFYGGISELTEAVSMDLEEAKNLADTLDLHAIQVAKYAQLSMTGMYASTLAKALLLKDQENDDNREEIAAEIDKLFDDLVDLARSKQNNQSNLVQYNEEMYEEQIEVTERFSINREYTSFHTPMSQSYNPDETFEKLLEEYRIALEQNDFEKIRELKQKISRKISSYISENISDIPIYYGNQMFKDTINHIIRNKPKVDLKLTFRVGGDEYGVLIWNASLGVLRILRFDGNNIGATTFQWGREIGDKVIDEQLRIIHETEDITKIAQAMLDFFNNMGKRALVLSDELYDKLKNRLSDDYFGFVDGKHVLIKIPDVKVTYNGTTFPSRPMVSIGEVVIDTNLIPNSELDRDYSVIQGRADSAAERAKKDLKDYQAKQNGEIKTTLAYNEKDISQFREQDIPSFTPYTMSRFQEEMAAFIIEEAETRTAAKEICKILGERGIKGIEPEELVEVIVKSREVGGKINIMELLKRAKTKGLRQEDVILIAVKIGEPIDELLGEEDALEKGPDVIEAILNTIVEEMDEAGTSSARKILQDKLSKALVSLGLTEAQAKIESKNTLELIELGLHIIAFEPFLNIAEIDSSFMDFVKYFSELAGVSEDKLIEAFSEVYFAKQIELLTKGLDENIRREIRNGIRVKELELTPSAEKLLFRKVSSIHYRKIQAIAERNRRYLQAEEKTKQIEKPDSEFLKATDRWKEYDMPVGSKYNLSKMDKRLWDSDFTQGEYTAYLKRKKDKDKHYRNRYLSALYAVNKDTEELLTTLMNTPVRNTVESREPVGITYHIEDYITFNDDGTFSYKPGAETIFRQMGEGIKITFITPDNLRERTETALKATGRFEKTVFMTKNLMEARGLLIREGIDEENGRIVYVTQNEKDAEEAKSLGIKSIIATKDSAFHATLIFAVLYARAGKVITEEGELNPEIKSLIQHFLKLMDYEDMEIAEILEELKTNGFYFAVELIRIKDVLQEFQNRRISIATAA